MKAGHLHFKDVPKLGGPPGLSWHMYELPCFLTGQVDRQVSLALPSCGGPDLGIKTPFHFFPSQITALCIASAFSHLRPWFWTLC